MRRLLRVVVIVVVAGLVVALVARLRRREEATEPAPTPWAPLEDTTSSPSATEPAGGTDGSASPSTATSSGPPATDWVEPTDGACPTSHPVKAKLSSGIFHVESGLNYARTKADRCYVSPEAAEDDGLRASKN